MTIAALAAATAVVFVSFRLNPFASGSSHIYSDSNIVICCCLGNTSLLPGDRDGSGGIVVIIITNSTGSSGSHTLLGHLLMHVGVKPEAEEGE
jgi:hypothetical protein